MLEAKVLDVDLNSGCVDLVDEFEGLRNLSGMVFELAHFEQTLRLLMWVELCEVYEVISLVLKHNQS